MGRRPPLDVRKILRKEVGFGCPVPDCGRPYLEWHHFDPPWHEQNHHNPKGMIALCREHHIQADSGAFTKDQLQKFKQDGEANWKKIKGKFNWMRNKILLCVGGNFYYDTPVPIEFQNNPLIWFNRDPDNYLLLNLNMLSSENTPRVFVRDNEWFNLGEAEDIECPPSAKKLDIKYPNGDRLVLSYSELKSIEEANKEYPGDLRGFKTIEYPVTTLGITINVGTPDGQVIPSNKILGVSSITGNFIFGCKVGLSIR